MIYKIQTNAKELGANIYRDAFLAVKIAAVSFLFAAFLVISILFGIDGTLWTLAAFFGGAACLIGLLAAAFSQYLRRLLMKYGAQDLPLFVPKSKLLRRFVSDRI